MNPHKVSTFTGPGVAALSVLVLVLVATSCSSASNSAPATVAETTTTVASCGSGGDVTPGLQERSYTDSLGTARTWMLSVPASYVEGTASDVVFSFHGSSSNGTDQYNYSRFQPFADRDGAILVLPNGSLSNSLYGDESAWSANLRTSDVDIEFTNDIVDIVRSEYCTGSFVATGMSAGADMVAALACQADTPFVGFGLVTYLYYTADDCGSAGPRPIVFFHGTDDYAVPTKGSEAPWFDPPVEEAVQRWADHNGCDGERIEERFSDEVIRYSWDGCDAPIEWFVIEGGGHTWPGSFPIEDLGYTTEQISASEIIWDRFVS